MAQTLLKQLILIYGACNLPHTACRELTELRQCRSFWKQYILYLATSGHILDPYMYAKDSMERIFNDFDLSVKERWRRALPEVFE